jgi:hypothetical protein
VAGIFLSYRREDAGGHAGRLYDKLADRFGDEMVFRDIDTLRPGSVFVEYIEASIANADVVIAMIGRDWISATDAEGRLRLADPNDYVRFELETALRRNVRVIPVLVRNPVMPRADDLPGELSLLAQRHAFELPDQHWPFAVDALIAALSDFVAPANRDAVRDNDSHSAAPSSAAWEFAVAKIDVGQLKPPELLEALKAVCAEFDEGRRPNETLVTVATVVDGSKRRVLILTSRALEVHSIDTNRERGTFDAESHQVIDLENIRSARKRKRLLSLLERPWVLELDLKVPMTGPSGEQIPRVDIIFIRPRGRMDEMLRYIQAKGG